MYLAWLPVVHAAVVDGVDGGKMLEHVIVGGERRRRYGRAEMRRELDDAASKSVGWKETISMDSNEDQIRLIISQEKAYLQLLNWRISRSLK